MKSILKKYGFAVMSVSVIAGYFLFTGGVMNTAVDVPPPTITVNTATVNTTVGRGVILSVNVRDNAAHDQYTTTVCNPPDLTPLEVTNLLPKLPMEVEYSTKLNSPGSVATDWSVVSGVDINNNYFINKSFNAPGVYTVTVRARVKRVIGYSAYDTKTMTVTVTGTAPLAPKKYTFVAMVVRYDDGRPGLQVAFTDPTNQYFIIKDENKIDMVFKWKPNDLQLFEVPELATNYDVREINKQYELFSKEDIGPGRWRYDIKTDQTGRVSFDFDDRNSISALFYRQKAKTGSGLVNFELYFNK